MNVKKTGERWNGWENKKKGHKNGKERASIKKREGGGGGGKIGLDEKHALQGPAQSSSLGKPAYKLGRLPWQPKNMKGVKKVKCSANGGTGEFATVNLFQNKMEAG